MLKCFRPLLNSMRVVGLYFTPSPRIHDVASRSATESTDSEIPRKWNGGRIYAVFMLVMAWLNAGRMLSAFDKTDKFGVVLLLKLAVNASGLYNALMQTSFFVASLTGNLDRVFLDARLLKSDVTRYRRLAVIHAVVCWIGALAHVPIYVVPLFVIENEMSVSTIPFGIHVFVSGFLLVVVKFVMAVLLMVSSFVWCFSHSVNYAYTSYYLLRRVKVHYSLRREWTTTSHIRFTHLLEYCINLCRFFFTFSELHGENC